MPDSNGTPAAPEFKGIGSLIASKWLSVPMFQRSYAWDEDHVNTLFEDLSNAIGTEPQYFLGSIIMTPAKDDRLEVIDGQQRLATVTILIASIRDYISANESQERATEIQREFLMSKNVYTMSTNARLVLNREDKEFFEGFVLASPSDDSRKRRSQKRSHRRIATALDAANAFVKKFVSPYREKDRAAQLMRLVRYLNESACVICFTVKDHANAYTIFETLNDRGLELSQADLVKNHIFSAVGDARLDTAQQNWAEMLGALEAVGGRDMTATFIRHQWISRHGHLKDRSPYKHINREVKGSELASGFSKELCDSAPLYAALLSSRHVAWEPFGEAAISYVDALKALGVERLRPLLLAVMRSFPYDHEKTKHQNRKCVEEVNAILKLMVSWSVRFLIAGPAAGTVEEHLNATALQVTKGEITSAKDLAKAMTKIVVSDKEFRAKFETATASKTSLVHYYLRALENSFDTTDEEPAKVVNLRDDVINIEHILPENPHPDWNIDKDTADAYCHRIGNLTLMRCKLNSKAANAIFPMKLPFYAQEESLQLTAQLTRYTEWNPQLIEERQKMLADLAVRIWSVKA